MRRKRDGAHCSCLAQLWFQQTKSTATVVTQKKEKKSKLTMATVQLKAVKSESKWWVETLRVVTETRSLARSLTRPSIFVALMRVRMHRRQPWTRVLDEASNAIYSYSLVHRLILLNPMANRVHFLLWFFCTKLFAIRNGTPTNGSFIVWYSGTRHTKFHFQSHDPKYIPYGGNWQLATANSVSIDLLHYIVFVFVFCALRKRSDRSDRLCRCVCVWLSSSDTLPHAHRQTEHIAPNRRSIQCVFNGECVWLSFGRDHSNRNSATSLSLLSQLVI